MITSGTLQAACSFLGSKMFVSMHPIEYPACDAIHNTFSWTLKDILWVSITTYDASPINLIDFSYSQGVVKTLVCLQPTRLVYIA
jgi:hypothetical protein